MSGSLEGRVSHLLELPLEADEVHLGEVCSKAGWEVQVYAVHSVKLGHPGIKIPLVNYASTAAWMCKCY